MRSELRAAINDAMERHDRDANERDEPGECTHAEYLDAIWGRLPAAVRRSTDRDAVELEVVEIAEQRLDDATDFTLWAMRELRIED